MGLQSADAIKFRFRKHFGTAFERSNAYTKAVVIKKDLWPQKSPLPICLKTANRNGGDEAYHRKMGRIDTMLVALRQFHGKDVTVHGFRSTFADWVQDATSFDPRLAKLALAHSIGNQVEQAYARSDMLEKRKPLMQAWSDHCTQ